MEEKVKHSYKLEDLYETHFDDIDHSKDAKKAAMQMAVEFARHEVLRMLDKAADQLAGNVIKLKDTYEPGK